MLFWKQRELIRNSTWQNIAILLSKCYKPIKIIVVVVVVVLVLVLVLVLVSLVQTVRVFSEDIGMEFGIEKCAMLVMEKGKIVKSVGIELPDGKVIKPLQEGQSYKYLGILEADKFLEERMKLNVSKECIRRLRKVLKSKLNGGNLVHGVNAWAVSLLRYSAAFFSWRKSELEAIDRKTRKLFTIYEALHPKSDVDRLYIPRKEGERGLISIKDCVEVWKCMFMDVRKD